MKVMKTVKVTPTITAALYTANDQLGGIQDLSASEVLNRLTPSGPLRKIERGTRLKTVTIVDKAIQNAAIEIFFFNSLPVVAGDANAMSLTDAEMTDKFIGKVAIAALDWGTLALNSAVSKEVDLLLASKDYPSAYIYAVPMVTTTPTYVSTSDLVFTYVFEEL